MRSPGMAMAAVQPSGDWEISDSLAFTSLSSILFSSLPSHLLPNRPAHWDLLYSQAVVLIASKLPSIYLREAVQPSQHESHD